MAKEIDKTEPKVEDKKEEKQEEEIVVKEVKIPEIEKKDSYSKDEVDNLLKEASKNGAQQGVKIAKEQLYPEIDRLKEKIKESSTKMSELQSQIPSTVEEKQKLEKEKTDLATELAQTKTSLNDAQSKLNAVESTALDAIDQVKNLSTKLDAKELSEFRLQKIAEANGKIIPEMVTGSSKEEIEASVEKAKTKYSDLVEGVRKNLNLPSVDEQTKIEEQNKENSEVPEVTRIKEKTDFTTWKGNREEMRRKLYRSYGVDV
jgi:chromosome segregation ATPase